MKRFYVTVWTPTHGGGFHESEYRNAETGEGPYTYGTSLAGVAIALENRGIPVCKIQEVERGDPTPEEIDGAAHNMPGYLAAD